MTRSPARPALADGQRTLHEPALREAVTAEQHWLNAAAGDDARFAVLADNGIPWAIADLALDMSRAGAGLRDPRDNPVPLRMGIATGPVVAGVVGARRFFYDVWGDAVNVASRMESTDPEGRIQVPENVFERLRESFVLEERGEVDIKGKGLMRTWYLVGRKPAAAVGSPPPESPAPALRSGSPPSLNTR